MKKKKGELPPNISEEELLCEQTRFALFENKSLTDEQKKHFENCAFCRSYQAETQQLADSLKDLGEAITVRDGVGLADSVMNEIDVQSSLFGHASFARRPAVFRHAGLAAACVILVVMAAPTILGLFDAGKGNDHAISMYASDASDMSDMAVENGSAEEELDGSATLEKAVPENEADYADEDLPETEFESDDASEADDRSLLFDASSLGTSADKDTQQKKNKDSVSASQSKASADKNDRKSQKSQDAKKSQSTEAPSQKSVPSTESAFETESAAAEQMTAETASDSEKSDADVTSNTSDKAGDIAPSVSANDTTTPSVYYASLSAAPSSASDEASNESLSKSADSTDASDSGHSSGGGGAGSTSSSGAANADNDAEHTKKSTSDSELLSDSADTAGNNSALPEETEKAALTTNSGTTHTSVSLTDAAYAAASGAFSEAYEIHSESAVSQQFDTMACVTFSTNDPDVRIQVFMDCDSDSSDWKVSHDSSGNAQIFEIHAAYEDE